MRLRSYEKRDTPFSRGHIDGRVSLRGRSPSGDEHQDPEHDAIPGEWCQVVRGDEAQQPPDRRPRDDEARRAWPANEPDEVARDERVVLLPAGRRRSPRPASGSPRKNENSVAAFRSSPQRVRPGSWPPSARSRATATRIARGRSAPRAAVRRRRRDRSWERASIFDREDRDRPGDQARPPRCEARTGAR